MSKEYLLRDFKPRASSPIVVVTKEKINIDGLTEVSYMLIPLISVFFPTGCLGIGESR